MPRILRPLLLALWLAFAIDPVAAQTVDEHGFAQQVEQWSRDLDEAEQRLRGAALSDEQATRLRRRVLDIVSEARAARERDTALQAQSKRLLDALGPPPAAGAPPEDADLAARRRALEQLIAAQQTRARQAEFAIARIDTLLSAADSFDRERRAHKLLERGPPPIDPGDWVQAAGELIVLIDIAVLQPLLRLWRGFDGSSRTLPLIASVLSILAASAVSIALRSFLRQRFGWRASEDDPPYPRRLLAAVAEGAAGALLPVMIAAALYAGLVEIARISGPVEILIRAAAVGAIAQFGVRGLARAALAPSASHWRLVAIRDEASLTLTRLFDIGAALLGLLAGIRVLVRHWGVPLVLEQIGSFVVSAVIAIFLFLLMRYEPWRIEAGATAIPGSRRWAFVRLLIRAAALVALAAGVIGYYNLARFIAVGLLLSSVIVTAYSLLRLLVREGLALALTAKSRRSVQLRIKLGLTDEGASRLAFWLSILFQVALILACGLLLLLAWGVPWYTVSDQLRDIGQGVKIGNTLIRPDDLGAALLVFFVGLFITRALQRGLQQRILPQTTFDRGVRDSIAAGVGYIGIVIAAALGITALGLDLSNIALIAGALSVGIGFGLQSIVNNFVSGIILLIERPIKVGDWVVIGSNEGHVRRISVRSTEVETFRRASVIIPNADILSSALINWTHKDKNGRVEVTVGVDYSSDPEQVRELLLKVIRNHPSVNPYPAPFVLFQDFGADALVFVLRGFVANVETRANVESDLRFAIQQAFQEAGVKFPYPQREISFRDMDHFFKSMGEVFTARPQSATKPDA